MPEITNGKHPKRDIKIQARPHITSPSFARSIVFFGFLSPKIKPIPSKIQIGITNEMYVLVSPYIMATMRGSVISAPSRNIILPKIFITAR